MSEEQEIQADVMLQVQNVCLQEVQGGKAHTVADGVEMLVISIVPSAEEIEFAGAQLNLPPGTLQSNGEPLVFVIIGDYKIPLSPVVPCVQQSTTSFMFVIPNLFMQLVLPGDTSVDELDAFEMLIKNYGSLRKKPGLEQQGQASSSPVEPQQQSRDLPVEGTLPLTEQHQHHHKPRLSSRVALGLGKITRFAVGGIKKGTEVIQGGVAKGSDKIVEKTDKKEAIVVPEDAKQAVQQTRLVTQGAVMVSTGMAQSLIGVTAVLGNAIGGQVSKRAPKAVDPKYDGVKEVGSAAITCAGTIMIAATDAASTILTSTCDGIGKVVRHRYGDEAGDTAQDGLGIVTDAVKINNTMKNVGAKAILKQTAKHSAAKVVSDLEAEEAANQAQQGSPQ